jgi:hypothetical protein
LEACGIAGSPKEKEFIGLLISIVLRVYVMAAVDAIIRLCESSNIDTNPYYLLCIDD